VWVCGRPVPGGTSSCSIVVWQCSVAGRVVPRVGCKQIITLSDLAESNLQPESLSYAPVLLSISQNGKLHLHPIFGIPALLVFIKGTCSRDVLIARFLPRTECMNGCGHHCQAGSRHFATQMLYYDRNGKNMASVISFIAVKHLWISREGTLQCRVCSQYCNADIV
jgi:hypothetical protein